MFPSCNAIVKKRKKSSLFLLSSTTLLAVFTSFPSRLHLGDTFIFPFLHTLLQVTSSVPTHARMLSPRILVFLGTLDAQGGRRGQISRILCPSDRVGNPAFQQDRVWQTCGEERALGRLILLFLVLSQRSSCSYVSSCILFVSGRKRGGMSGVPDGLRRQFGAPAQSALRSYLLYTLCKWIYGTGSGHLSDLSRCARSTRDGAVPYLLCF